MKRYYSSPLWLLLLGGALLAVLALLISPRVLGGRMAVQVPPSLTLALGLIGALLMLVALAVVVLGPAGRAAASRRNYGSHATVIGLTVLVALSSLLVMVPVLLSGGSGRGPSVAGFLLSTLVLDGALIGAVYFRVVRPRIITWRDMGLSADQLPRTLRAGLKAAPVLFLLAGVLELLLKLFGVHQTQHESLEWLRGVPLWQYLLVAVSAAVLAPVAEEIYFRGYVFRAYLAQKGPVPAYVFSSLLFALVHLNLQALLPIFVVGLFLAYVYHRTGSVLPGMIAHGFNNSVAFTLLYFSF